MKLCRIASALTLSLSLLLASQCVVADTATVADYTCETDADCDKHFTNTVCITVDNYGVEVKKCTPNTKARPACRGAQPGMCPSYQSAEVGYLNLQCIFVAEDGETTSASSTAGSSSTTGTVTAARYRYLMAEIGMVGNTTNTTTTNTTTASTPTPAADASTTGSTSDEISISGSGSTAADDEAGPTPKSTTTVVINKVKVTGHFECVDVSDCENKAYDTSTCLPSTCGPSGSLEQCNTHGTCTYPTVQSMSKRRCMCNKGYSGDKCQTEVSGACDTDCGIGGDCVDGLCSCKKGFDGKSYKGKAGKSNRRCTKCTNDLACQNSNSCDIETGSCVCSPGYSGITCGATEDGCTTKKCGDKGVCQVAANGTGICMCSLCSPTCSVCPTKDCSTCPSLASHVQFSKITVLVSVLVTVVVGNLASYF